MEVEDVIVGECIAKAGIRLSFNPIYRIQRLFQLRGYDIDVGRKATLHQKPLYPI